LDDSTAHLAPTYTIQTPNLERS